MTTIDVKGKKCPEPLIITKRAIRTAQVGDSFAILLDNEVATCNLEEFLHEMKINTSREDDGDTSLISFTIGAEPIKVPNISEFCAIPSKSNEQKGDYVVVISSEGMGKDADGSNSLGKMLMIGYLNSLAEQDLLPQKVILYNSGVLLASRGADTIVSMKKLSERGVDIILCGICVDYYELKEKIEVGRIGNMFDITRLTSVTGHVVYP